MSKLRILETTMPKKESTKKHVSAASLRGKAAVEKGKKFEDTVADVYRLLGAEVTQNIEICNKKVDILATFQLPGSTIGHRVIIECKDEQKVVNQNQRVMQFQGLLDTTRKAGEADSAAIITRVPWGDEAKGFARRSGIELLTYTEKIAQLIDFTTYLKDRVNIFENGDIGRPHEAPLGKYYVDISAERITKKGTEQFPVIDDYINQWMQHDNAQHLAILGEYGTGKSSWCHKLAHDLAASYLQTAGSAKIPILFNLREFTKTLKIESLVTSFLDDECDVQNPKFKLFHAMNNAGIFLLIFDGFDEMAVRVDADTLEINLQEIEKLAASPSSKVIITSRVEYFISGAEEKKSLCPKGDLLATRQTEYESLKIVPWSDEQVDSFLEKRVPLIKEAEEPWEYYRDCIKKIKGLSDLSRRPVLLDMIVKTLPQLIASGESINRPNLYETYLIGEIKRQRILKHRTFLLSEDSRMSLLQNLALDFYVGEISAITFTDGLKHVEKIVKPPKNELEAYTRDFLTCSFLIRKGDEYQFSHRSIMEYLIAKGLLKEIEMNAPNSFNHQRLEPVVGGFLSELNPNKDTLWNWIESTKSETKEEILYIGGNAATLLCMLDKNALSRKDLSKAALTGADLNSADLRGANLCGTVMKNVNLAGAKFFKHNIESSIINNIRMSALIFYDPGIDEDNFSNLLDTLNSAGIRGYRVDFVRSTPHLMGLLITFISNIENLQLCHSIIGNHSGVIAFSIYNDENDELLKIIPELLKARWEQYLNDARCGRI